MAKREVLTSEEYTYTVIFEPDEAGGYVAMCPAVPGLVTAGRSLEKARSHALSAIRKFLEGLRENGQPLPPSEGQVAPIRERVSVVLQRL